jgi:hypothetical protein
MPPKPLEGLDMAAHCISLEPHGTITVMRLNRPPANAFSMELARECEAALDAKEVSAAKALVLTGTGPFFSGGLDLKAVPTYSQAEQRDFLGVLKASTGTPSPAPSSSRWPRTIGSVPGTALSSGLPRLGSASRFLPCR